MNARDIMAKAMNEAAEIDYVLSALDLAGYVIMPKVPTQDMVEAWRLDQSQGRSLESSYLAMLNAAPSPIRG